LKGAKVSKGAVLALAGLIAALAVVVGGCGSGGDSTTTTLTKAQFVKQVDALCEEREKERTDKVSAIASTLKPGQKLSNTKQTEMVESIIFPSYAKMIENVESLEAPEGDQAEINEIIKAMEKAQNKVEADPRQAVFSVVMFEEANGLAKKYGLQHCII
jgi:hypothetical protein